MTQTITLNILKKINSRTVFSKANHGKKVSDLIEVSGESLGSPAVDRADWSMMVI